MGMLEMRSTSRHSYSSTQNLQNHTSHPTTHPQKRNRSTLRCPVGPILQTHFSISPSKNLGFAQNAPKIESCSHITWLKMKVIHGLFDPDRLSVTFGSVHWSTTHHPPAGLPGLYIHPDLFINMPPISVTNARDVLIPYDKRPSLYLAAIIIWLMRST